MLDINYLNALFQVNPRYSVKNDKVCHFTKVQYNEILDRIHSQIYKANIYDATIPKEGKTNRNIKWREDNPEIYDNLLEMLDGDVCNILKRIHKDEFAKMDMDRNTWNPRLNFHGKVVYIYQHKEIILDREVELYIKFNFSSEVEEDDTIYLTSCHEPQKPIIKIPPLL